MILEASGQVVLVGATAETPTLAELLDVAARISDAVPLVNDRSTNETCKQTNRMIEEYCRSIGAELSLVDSTGKPHGPHTWYTAAGDRRFPFGFHAGSMTEAVLHIALYAKPDRVPRVVWSDPDYSIYQGLKSNAESMERLERDAEKRSAKVAAREAEGLLGLLGDWNTNHENGSK